MGALPQIKYSGAIREIRLGKPGCELTIGGQTGYNFYTFEGNMPNAPRLALQVLDVEPEEWADEALAPFRDVLSDPVAWARLCAEEYGADLVCLWLAGTDPNGRDLSPAHAAEVSKSVAEAINVPLIVWGVSNDEKNREVLKAVAEACAGYNLVLGPVTEANYKQVGAAAIAYKHVVAANTPIDINLAKQLNILLENLGVPSDRILIDPTTGAVGYGLEYCYSIMERIRQAALTQNDEKLQYPIINNIAEEVWKTKEAKLESNEDLRLGDASLRAINLEAVTALSALQAGSDLLILRHPRTLAHVRRYLQDLMNQTDLESMHVDLSLVPSAQEAPPAVADTKPPQKADVARPTPLKEEVPQAAPPEPVAEKVAVDERTPEPAVETAQQIVEFPKIPGPRAQSQQEEAQLTEEDLEALREMLRMFRSMKNAIGALSRIISGSS